MFNTTVFGTQLNFSTFTPAGGGFGSGAMGAGGFGAMGGSMSNLGMGGLGLPSAPSFGGAAPCGPPMGGYGSSPAGSFCPSCELGQASDTSGISGLMQAMAQTFALAQMMAQMTGLQNLWNGGANGMSPVNAGQPNFGSRGPTGAKPAKPAKGQGKAKSKKKKPKPSATKNAGGAEKSGSSKRAAKKKTGKIVNVPGGRLDSAVAGAVTAMIKDAKKDGVNLGIESSLRTRAEQERLYAAYKNGTGNLAAKPGTSNHESGLAIDFKNTPGAFDWLKKNAGRYGLKNLPGEPWHYSPTGT